jgi:UrcA family protein
MKPTPPQSETDMNKALTLILAVAAGAATISTASAATPATATTPDADVPSVVVRYGDLNLATEQGTQTLYRRIAFVARQVCPDGESRGLENLNRARACQRDAIARAVKAVHNERLAAMFSAAYRRG